MTFEAACMTPEERILWERANALLRTGTRADRPCRDCPFAFASRMRESGCCNGAPLDTGRAPSGRPRLDPWRPRLDDTKLRRQWREAAQRRRNRLRLAAGSGTMNAVGLAPTSGRSSGRGLQTSAGPAA